MLKITIPGVELFDNNKNEFVLLPERTIVLEHSLVSISKWEAKFHKPFLGKEPKTVKETIEYIRCMTLTQNVPKDVYDRIDRKIIDQIDAYIQDPMTATWFSHEKSNGRSRETVTAELIYYWMISLGIPFECQKWHLNRLLTLVKVCNAKSAKPKKMSKRELASRNHSLNAARRKALNTKG